MPPTLFRAPGLGAWRSGGLVLPPAWHDVWICPHPRGHIQAWPGGSIIGADSRSELLLTLRLVDAGPVAVIEVAGELDMDTTRLLTDLAGSVLAAQSPPVMVLDAGLRTTE
jgi:hypothetical protein